MLNPRYSELEAKGEPTEQWGYDNPMVALRRSIYCESFAARIRPPQACK